MSALFSAKTKITYDEYKKYSLYLLFAGKRKLKMLLTLVFVIAFVLICYFVTGYYDMFILLPIYAVGFPLLYFYRLKKSYKSDKSFAHETELAFYSDCVETKCGESSGRIFYEDIYAVYETETNFYIMIAAMQGLIVIKENCPEGLIEFVRNIKKD